MPNISLGTVYRNLNSLVDSKEIRRIHTIDNIDRFDKLETVHDHFICTSCNQIYDIPPITLPKLEGKKVLDYELTIRGICEKCQKERK
jgi:Fur family peroxide stress response transcriptional regulator